MIRLTICLSLLVAISGCALKSGTYDSSIEPRSGIVFGEKTVDPKTLETIEAEIIEVCSKSGCWIKMSPPESLRHTRFLLGRFKNRDFTPPANLKGKTARVSGRYIRQRYSPRTHKKILTDIGLGDLADQVKNQPVERMEFEVHTLEVL